ncbi:MAG TPA: patatin-like phospholipase family protein [Acidimicrobiales bacterium]|nr:patatin-like phospholipase family protein [Acidimicrobiales bacterium]
MSTTYSPITQLNRFEQRVGNRFVLGLLAAAALAVFQFLSAVDGLSGELHLDNRAGGSITDLSFNLTAPRAPNTDRVTEIVRDWKDHDCALRRETAASTRGEDEPTAEGVAAAAKTTCARLADPPRNVDISNGRELTGAFAAVDTFLFVPLYALALWSLILVRRRQPTGAGQDSVEQAYRTLTGQRSLEVALGVAVAADVVENIAVYNAVDAVFNARSAAVAANLAWVAGLVKWAALLVVVLPLVAAALAWLRKNTRTLVDFAPQIVLALIFVLAVRNAQAVDVVRGWDLVRWVWAGLLTTLFSFVLAACALSSSTDPTARGPVDVVAGRTRFAAGVAVGLLGVPVATSDAPGLSIPFFLLAALYLASCFLEKTVGDAEQSAATPGGGGVITDPNRSATPVLHRRVASLIAVVPLVALWSTVVTTNASSAVFNRFSSLPSALTTGTGWDVLWGTFLLLVTVAFLWALRRGLEWVEPSPTRRRITLLGSLAVLLSALLTVMADRSTFESTRSIGAVGVLALFLSVIAWSIRALNALGSRAMRSPSSRAWALPASLRILRIHRPPLVSGIVAWALLAGLLDPGGFHNARRISASGVDGRGRSIAEVASRWEPRQTPSGDVPMLSVSASGGGIRAAYWTAAVLDCVFERDFAGTDPCGAPAGIDVTEARRSRFVVSSGISGGSLGLVTYNAHILTPDERPRWYRDLLDDDFLSPTLARFLFIDVPNTFVRRSDVDDRAAVLEQAWERAWPGRTTSALARGFLATQTNSRQPLTILNGFAVDSACRVAISRLDTNGRRGPEDCGRIDNEPVAPGEPTNGEDVAAALDATSDLTDFLCPDEDIRLSTAALLSARFPFVSPSGRLETCKAGDGTTFVVDGGYRDTSAASTLTELWSKALAHKTAAPALPIFLQIDNGYDLAKAQQQDKRPNELAVPLRGQQRAPGGIATAARQSAERLFDPYFFRITTKAHPGGEAPLGWVLSDASQQDLDDQLLLNRNVIAKLRCVLDRGRQCELVAHPAP